MEKRPLAIVTGGSSGIGYAIANRLLQEKYEVINADIRPVEKENSEFLHFLQCNVVNAEDVDKLSRLVQETGVPKVLVLNAGRGVHEKIREGDPEKWFDIINTNICGTLRVLRAVLPFHENRKRVIYFFCFGNKATSVRRNLCGHKKRH